MSERGRQTEPFQPDGEPGEGRVSDRYPVKVDGERRVSNMALVRYHGDPDTLVQFEAGQLRQDLMRSRDVAVFWDSIKTTVHKDYATGDAVIRAYGYGYADE